MVVQVVVDITGQSVSEINQNVLAIVVEECNEQEVPILHFISTSSSKRHPARIQYFCYYDSVNSKFELRYLSTMNMIL